MQHRDKIILKKICSEIDLSLEFIENFTLEEFLSDEKTKHAIGMVSVNVGELTKNLSVEFREKYSQIAWKNSAKFRDVVAHKYETLNMSDVYYTVKNDFPEFKNKILEILESEN